MGYRYTLAAKDLTIGSNQTLVFVRPPASGLKEMAITKLSVGFAENATSAQKRILLVTQVSAFPTLITTGLVISPMDLATPTSPITAGTAGAAGTAGVLASSEGGGTRTIKVADSFNVLNGYLWVPTVGGEIVLPGGSASGFGVVFPDAVGTADGWDFTLEIEVR